MLQKGTVSFLAIVIAGGLGWMERSGAAQETPKQTHEMTLGAGEIRDQLGDKWTVKERSKGTFLATRKQPVKGDAKLESKVIDEIKSLRDDYKGALASFQGDEVMLRGRIDDCGDIPKAADRFAKIDGINRILIDVTCKPRQSSALDKNESPAR